MQRRTKLRIIYYLNVALILLLVGYQFYLHLSETDFKSLHSEQVSRIKTIAQQEQFNFAVVGNINNSTHIFQKQLIPLINASDNRFLISAGNAVSSGAEENYRSLFKLLHELDIPWLLTYGENEESDFGDVRFYKHLGPHFFSFIAGENHFLFVDNTGNSPLQWQLDWLDRELESSKQANRFVFIGLPLHQALEETPAFESENYFGDSIVRKAFIELFERHKVDVVFSANLSLFHQQLKNGVRYVTTGGAGGLIVNDEDSFHHYVQVTVNGDEIGISPVRLDISSYSILNTLDSVWSAIYTFIYVSFGRFLFVVSLMVLIGLKLREFIYQERDYYTQFNIDDSAYRDKPKRIAMFTNNYFPFISGVTMSIERLARGLTMLHHTVQVFAPDYEAVTELQPECERVKTLLAFGHKREFRLTNPLQFSIRKRFREFKPDLVHLHHPFWLGSVGHWLAKRHNLPTVYTYHTRLEMYALYVPLPGVFFRNVISHAMIRRFCNRCDGVIVPTFSTEEYLRLIGVKSRICVQPTGVDFDRFNQPHAIGSESLRKNLGLQHDDIVLLSVSRLGREKNIKFLLDALETLPRFIQQEVKLILVGEGDDREYLENRIVHKALSGKVQLIGEINPDNIPAYYQMADIFVFASKSETQGMVILEAMSAGLPVVAIRSSGIDDVIEHGKTGYKTLDDVEVWTKKLADLISDTALREQFSHNAIIFAKQHDIGEYAEKIDLFYSEILATHAQQERH